MKENTEIYNSITDTEELHIGGALVIDSGAKVSGVPHPQCENQAASTATSVATLKDDLNALLLKLKNAGLMKEDA